MKRKFLALFMAALLVLTLAGCTTDKADQKDKPSQPDSAEQPPTGQEPSTAPQDDVTIRVAALKGPTAIGMVKLMDDVDKGTAKSECEFTLAGAPDEITGSIIKGEFDIAAVPTNLAAVLYNKTQGQVQLAGLNTLGVLYIVENGDTVHNVGDLKDKTIYATGKGSTPEYALNYILAQSGLTADVQVEYKTEHAELAALLASGEADLALLPQPFVQSVLAQNEKARLAIDLTEAWDEAAQGKSALTMGCIVVQKDFAQQHPEALKTFLEEYNSSVEYVTDSANLEAAAALTEKFDIIKVAVAQKAIPSCNIVFITGDEMNTMAEGFYTVLSGADPASIGGKLPEDDFYYKG